MGTVTLDTLKQYGFYFSYPPQGDDKSKMEIAIKQAEAFFLDAILSPELADVFNVDPSDSKFTELREGFINDDHIRVKGLDYALNYYCAIAILETCNYSIVDKKFQKTTSKNTIEVSGSTVTSRWYNECSEIGDEITAYIEDNAETFAEFTEAAGIGTRNYFDL